MHKHQQRELHDNGRGTGKGSNAGKAVDGGELLPQQYLQIGMRARYREVGFCLIRGMWRLA